MTVNRVATRSVQKLASKGPEGTQAYGINEEGRVVGYFTDNIGSHGFIVEP